MAESIWPEDVFDANQPSNTPLSILREQCEIFNKKTKGKLLARAYTFPRGGHIECDFDLYPPTLNEYRYTIFTIKYGLAKPFPVALELYDPAKKYSCKSPAEFLAV